MNKYVMICTALIYISALFSGNIWAAYVTMSEFDINGDGVNEIVRTEGAGSQTNIKVYARIENSYFFKPAAEIQVPGKLVQVPDVADFNGDAICDLYFATGSDIGILYYDTIEETYKRENEIHGALSDVSQIPQSTFQEESQKMSAESDILLKIEMQEPQHAENEDNEITSI